MIKGRIDMPVSSSNTVKPLHVTIGPGFDLAKLLGPNGRLAVGDPAHVPVGHLCGTGAEASWGCGTAYPHIWRAPTTCAAALLLVERGEAPAGIVYGTDAAVSKGVMVAGIFPEPTATTRCRIRSRW